MIHLYEVWLPLTIQHNIEAKNFEAATTHMPSGEISRIKDVELPFKGRLCCNDGLHTNAAQFRPDPLPFLSAIILFNLLEKPLQRALATGTEVRHRRIHLKVVTKSVDLKIRKVHTHVA